MSMMGIKINVQDCIFTIYFHFSWNSKPTSNIKNCSNNIQPKYGLKIEKSNFKKSLKGSSSANFNEGTPVIQTCSRSLPIPWFFCNWVKTVWCNWISKCTKYLVSLTYIFSLTYNTNFFLFLSSGNLFLVLEIHICLNFLSGLFTPHLNGLVLV